MLFNSYTFLAFYAVVYLSYLLIRHRRAQNLLLLAASYVFYAAWDPRFLSLILLSTLVDYVAAIRIESLSHVDAVSSSRGRMPPGRSRLCWLLASLVTNLGVLAAFKYLGFASESLGEILGWVGLQASFPLMQIILPVGISFYTFQTLSYTIDVYRRRIPAERDLFDFALFVAFFPQLVAGPIERAAHFLPQIKRARQIRRTDLGIGLQFVLVGYFAKVVVADSVAPIVDQVFANPQRYSGAVVWSGAVGFAAQIYGDFLGYSLIARGISRWMGFRLVSNFRQPYLATSPRDFWHRWHRSLSFWLRRYVYFELGGSRCGALATYRNLLVTMVLGGLWHGAAWSFVLWGLYHGMLLVIEHVWRSLMPRGKTPYPVPLASGTEGEEAESAAKRPDSPQSKQSFPARQAAAVHHRPADSAALLRYAFGPLVHSAKVAITFLLVLIGWVLFRCESVGEIGVVFGRMFASSDGVDEPAAYALPILAALSVLMLFDVWRERNHSQLVLLRATLAVRWSVYVFLILCIVTVGFRPAAFLYFQF